MDNKNSTLADVATCPFCQGTNGVLELSRQSYRVVRCQQCSLVYAWPRQIPRRLYDDAYTDQGEYRNYLSATSSVQEGHLHQTWAMRRFFKTVRSGGRLLDIGCSTGMFLLAAQKQGWQVAGLDVSETAVATAHNLTGAPVSVGSITEFRSNEVFDAITAWEVLEHVPDPVAFVKAAVSLLKTGGVFALSVPNWNSPWMRRSTKREHWPPYHLTFWDRTTLRRLLRHAGLNNVLVKEKPFAWEEEVGRIKRIYLPIALLRSTLLDQKGMHLFALARKL